MSGTRRPSDAALAVGALVIMAAALVTLRATVVQAFKMPAGSMEPTLLIGDHFLVNKAAYGVRLPFLRSVVLRPRPPARFDLAIFLYPKDRSREYIKRVIGLPGETVELRGTTLYVDGRALDEPYASYLLDSDAGLVGEARRTWGPQQVPAGHVFVLGDNRDNSLDSRFFGCVPIADLLGKAKVVYFSWNSANHRVRWERIGLALR